MMKRSFTKRILSVLLSMVMLVGLLPTAAIPAFAEESENEIGEVSDGDVVEVSSWDEFEEAFALFHYTGESYTIKLMEDLHFNADDAPRSAEVLVDVHVRGCFVTLDFNGHTLSCTDNDMDSELSDFIRINLHTLDYNTPIEFILTDSVGGGGVSMDSYRWTDTELSALHIVDTRNYMHWGAIYQECQRCCKLTINGGNYTLNATTSKFSDGTLSRVCSYRGTVIADNLKDIEINGGTFTAKSGGVVTSFADMCARELSAFATVTSREGPGIVWTEYPVINGGTFISDGYAIHHFDCAYVLGESEQTVLPMINGGVFSGGVAYIGKTFTYSDGYEELENKKASEIINNDAYVLCLKDGNKYDLEDDLDLGDLHDADSLYVLSESLFELNILPDVGEITDIERYTEQSDTYQVQYKVPYGFTEDQITPYISVTPTGGMTATYQTTEKVINYSDYEDGLTVKAGIAVTASGEVLYFENTYNVAVSDLPSPPEILAQPYSMTVAPGECAEAMVVANHAVSYQWYYLYNGSSPMKLTESLVSALGGGITGYTSPRLSVTLNGVGREYFHCVVTGTDGSTVKTDRISFTYGTKPTEKSFGGGEYLANGNAEFKLFANYAETVTWHVAYFQSGSSQIYTLEEFKELTGCEYKTTHKGYLNGLYCATVVFENVDESFSGKYLVGYTMKNSLGSVTVIDPADMIPFTLSVTIDGATDSGATYNVRLIEPWALRVNVRFKDGAGNTIPVSEVRDYGAFAVRGSLLDSTSNVTLEQILADPDTIHFPMGTEANGGMFPTGDGRATFHFFDGLFTYRLSEEIYWVAYYTDAEGKSYFTKVRNKSLSTLMNSMMSGVSDNEAEVYSWMLDMEESILEYRNGRTGEATVENAKTVGTCGISFGTHSGNKYAFGRSYRISLIEPWGIMLNTRIYDTTDANTSSDDHIDYAAADNYGMIIYHDKSGSLSGMVDYTDLLARDDAYVYSKDQGNLSIDGTKVSVAYNKDIYTYELNSKIYCVTFVVIDGEYYYSAMTTRNLYELMGSRIESAASEDAEIRVYKAMRGMYESITKYRAGL